jgi:hypothetical protein
MAQLADAPAALLRRGLLWIAALSTVGIAAELGVARHWTQPIQLVAWGAVAALAVAIALLARTPSPRNVRFAQALAVVVVLSGLLGVWEHVYANYDAAPLDFRYADTWDSLPEATRWWLAATKSVGPSPPLASGALAQAALCVLLATLRHPALSWCPAGTRGAQAAAPRLPSPLERDRGAASDLTRSARSP